jgi:tetratricopeptide (TPR) repeat protein
MERKINIFLDRAIQAISHQKYINAIENYHKASILARRIGNYKLSILCLLEMADIYFEKQNYENALQFYKDALEMAEGTNTLERRDEIIKMIIQIYDFWHKKEELFKYIKKLGAEPPDLTHVDDIFEKSENIEENIQIYNSLVKNHYGYYMDKFQIMWRMLESNEHILYRFFGRFTSSVLGIAPKNGYFLITNKKFHVQAESADDKNLELSIPYETITP